MRYKISDFISSSVASISLCLGMLIFLSGCQGPKVLNSRGDIPSPTLTPGSNDSGIASSNDLDLNAVTDEHIKLSDEIITPPPQIENSLSLVDVKNGKSIQYTVKKGDSFWRIGKIYDVSMKELAAYNKMDLNKKLKYGTVLEIPPGGLLTPETLPKRTVLTKTKKITTAALLTGNSKYIVKRGDSLWSVAKKSKTSIAALAGANAISSKSHLKVGQKLVIPGKTKSKNKIFRSAVSTKKAQIQMKSNNTDKVTLSSNDKRLLEGIISEPNTPKKPKVAPITTILTPSYLPHTVKDGDTWGTVSDMYGVSISDLKKANPRIASEKELKTESIVNIPEE